MGNSFNLYSPPIHPRYSQNPSAGRVAASGDGRAASTQPAANVNDLAEEESEDESFENEMLVKVQETKVLMRRARQFTD